MPKFRKKPVVISAYKFDHAEGIASPLADWPEWLKVAYATGAVPGGFYFNDGAYYCVTLEGSMKVSDGDYIIRGVDGEIYPCKPDIFVKPYDAV